MVVTMGRIFEKIRARKGIPYLCSFCGKRPSVLKSSRDIGEVECGEYLCHPEICTDCAKQIYLDIKEQVLGGDE
ncbi:MAG: hypothetical protein DRO95_03205 [Candidatus Altiarchaeales archaeon]|nr:MAG: hypothetical protein DRO95_03205 [Candidatus Altiarchaeales archaeon]